VSSYAQVATLEQHFGDYRFERRGGVCALIDGRGLELSASADIGGRGLAGVDTLGQRELLAPSGVSEHIMRLRFRSRGLFTIEPAMHLALGLTGDWRKSDPSKEGFTGKVVGRGAIIGNVSGAPFGCPRWPAVQLESFHRQGNRLIADSGSPALSENQWYGLTLCASLDGRISYQLHDAKGECVAEAVDDDAGADVESNLGGWWITHVFSDHNPSNDWGFDIADLTIRWR